MKIKDPEEFINRRRRQVHVHSVIYYFLHTNIISDATFDTWAVELANAQKEYPQYKTQGYMWNVFQNWTGDTGMHLPAKDDVIALAYALLASAEKRSHTSTSIPKNQREKGAEPLNVVGYERD